MFIVQELPVHVLWQVGRPSPTKIRKIIIAYKSHGHRASDPEFVSTMADTTRTNENHSLARFYHYLDVAELSHRFAAAGLEVWAQKQLRGISRSLLSLAPQTQDIDYSLRALDYARIIQDKGFERRVQTFIQQSYRNILRTSTEPPTSTNSVRQQGLVTMFKRPELQQKYPSLFGFIFCVILSQGSQFWLSQLLLTREDRIRLLSAHVHLTPFPVSTLDLGWMDTLTETYPRGNAPELQSCAHCNFWPAWRVWIARYFEQFKEPQIPEGGAGLLSHLATRPVGFAQATTGVGSSCADNCRERFVEFVYEKTDSVFTRFAAFYKDVE